MDRLWAPWRLAYAADKSVPAPAGCFVCRVLADADDRANLVIWRRPLTIAILNRFPYNNGHVLVCPNRHVAGFGDPTPAEHAEATDTIARLLDTLGTLFKADGFNVGLNLGRAAGAGLPGHLHWHVVPRWEGDANFMPAVADTHVIVQSLGAAYDLLAPALAGTGGVS